ncbi:GNAT family N-acetyltransferase [Streptomyces sp. ME02-8801-2C]|uniref:GNAT family N-acetyltransferase n=1 Tax=Streptomyces sp. ME02-8801-2C TaxID=3028680 RepID=UPI0029BB2D38|nr:GNAT family N-acetyltransferase [Streptomyces sp. ME02-8801-2C]MDX3451223.1 GNAT family N-acetyltransferase [Streptomyces sp. ME02-8801-2C]
MRIRTATPAELPALRAIERAAGSLFRTLGTAAPPRGAGNGATSHDDAAANGHPHVQTADIAEIADDEPPALEVLERYRQEGRAWVAADDENRLVAYLIAEPVDGDALHVEQVSVHPDFAHRGIGKALLAYAAERARDEGLTHLTLTTFNEVPWNAPYYARLGFRTLDQAELTPGLRKIRATEAEHGLDRWPRVCMRRP